MSKLFVDTLFVVALVSHRDQYHERAIELAKEYESYPLLTTNSVPLEIGNSLARNFKAQAIQIINEFRKSDEVEIVHLSSSLFDKAYQIYQDYQDKEWGLVDCVSFVVMREANIDSALTFDQHFVQAGFKALMRVEE